MRVKACYGGVQMFKNLKLVILFDMFLNPNFKSFTSFSYKIGKIGLIKYLIDGSFKICNNWNSFRTKSNTKSNLIKNKYPSMLIDKIIKIYLNYKFSSNQNQLKDTSEVHYFKLPYIRNLSHLVKKRLSKLYKKFCKENFNIKLLHSKLKIIFHIKTQFLIVLAVVLAILAKLILN